MASLALVGMVGCERRTPAAPPPRSTSAATVAQRATTPAGKPAPFVDVTRAAGIDFVHDPSATGKFYFPEEEGSGGAFLDYDNDGDLDIYLIQGGRTYGTDEGLTLPNRLYRNNGDGTFSDVTDGSHTGDTGYGMGVACADYDNDGDTDIFITNLGPNVLLRNNGDGTFSDVSQQAGFEGAGFFCSAAFFDYDRDGWLDLYVTNYVDWSPAVEGICYGLNNTRDYCTPLTYKGGLPDHLYHNRRDGTFEDVSRAAGIAQPARNGFGVVCADFDGDGWEDIYVANDQQPNFLWHNNADGTFTDRGVPSGSAFDASGRPQASMGVTSEDADHDGDFDILSTNIRGECHAFHRNDGGMFEDLGARLGLGSWSTPDTGFGVGFLDYDNDSRFDLFVANGAVNIRAEPMRPDNPYAERNRLVHSLDNGRWVDVTDAAGPALQSVEMSRGAVFGDYDHDGRIDVLVTNNRGPAQLLRNNVSNGNHWIRIRTVGVTDNRDGIGALVHVHSQAEQFVRQVRPHYSYLSSNEPTVHFGLGRADPPVSVTIRWPCGALERWDRLAVDRLHTLTQGGGAPQPVAPAGH
jgi:hypothetical protein